MHHTGDGATVTDAQEYGTAVEILKLLYVIQVSVRMTGAVHTTQPLFC